MKKIYLLLFGLFILSNQLLAQDEDKKAAWKLFQQDSILQAKTLIEKATKSGPTSLNAETWYYRSMIYNVVNSREELKVQFPDIEKQVLESYKRCIELDRRREYADNCREDIYYLAVEFLNVGISHYDEGLNTGDRVPLNKAISYFTLFLEAYNELGTRKISLLKLLKENQLDDNTILFFRAVAKERSGDISGAESDYLKLVQNKYNDPQLYLNLKDMYLKQEKRDKAIQVIRKGQERMPDHSELTSQLALLHAEGKEFDEAMDIAQKLHKTDRQSTISYVTIAKVYEYMQDWENVEETYTEALRRDEDDFYINHSMGTYYLRRGAIETSKERAEIYYGSALPYLERANRVNPRSQANLQSLYEVYVKLDNQKKADQIKSRLR